MMRAALAGGFLAALAALAQAGDWERGETRAEIARSLVAEGPAGAIAVLDRILDEATPRIRARHAEAARAALDLLPRDEVADRTARLLCEALRLEPSDRDGVWTSAQELRRDVIRRADVPTAERLIGKLIEIYPNVVEYRHDLARVLLGAGRRAEAKTTFETIRRMAPSDLDAAYEIGKIAQWDGDYAGAAAVYARVLEDRPAELRAHLLRVQVLARIDRAAAREALAEGMRTAEASKSEALRTQYLDRFERERSRLDAADRRRAALDDIDSKQRTALCGVLAAWMLAAVAAFRLTRGRVPTGAAAAPAEN